MMLVLRGRHLGPVHSDRCLSWFTDLHVGITKRLKNVEVLEGEGCNFECILSHEDTGDTATWTVGGKTLGSAGRFRATRQGRKYILEVREALLSDTGEVVFSVRGLTSKASLLVKGGHHAPGQMGHSPQATCSGAFGWAAFQGRLLETTSLSHWWGPRALVGMWGFWSSGGRSRASGLAPVV